MYSKLDASKIRQEFWTSFGLYMSPLCSAEGEKINWVNYKTGEKFIHFRMHAENKTGYIGIELSHPDQGIRELYFQQLLEYKKILEEETGEVWTWEPQATDEYGKVFSQVFTRLNDVQIFKKDEWPQLISFFKTRIMALDRFWSRVKYGFEALG